MNTWKHLEHLETSGNIWTSSPPGGLGRVPPSGEQNLVGRPELNQPPDVLLRHCRWRSEVRGSEVRGVRGSEVSLPHRQHSSRLQVLTLVGGVLLDLEVRFHHGDVGLVPARS